MATKIGFSFSSSHFQHNTNAKLRSSQFVNQLSVAPLAIYDKDKPYLYIHGVQKLRGRLQKQQTVLVVDSEDQSQISELETEVVEPENHDSTPENNFPISNSSFHLSGNDGKPGVVSFHNCAFSRDNEVILSNPERTQNSISWSMGPAVLFAALVVPPFCSHKVLRSVCGDSPLLRDSPRNILLRSNFLFGLAVFLLLLDRLMRPIQLDPSAKNSDTLTPQLGQGSFSVATLVLSIGIPMITMRLTWQWVGPAALATLAPYLAGIVVQFTFEQLARYWKSPSWAAIPFIFQVNRLRQLYTAASILTCISFNIRAAEMTYSKLPYCPYTSSLGIILIALELLFALCIWSFSSFLMRFLPSAASATTL